MKILKSVKIRGTFAKGKLGYAIAVVQAGVVVSHLPKKRLPVCFLYINCGSRYIHTLYYHAESY